MNKIKSSISKIDTIDNLNIVEFAFESVSLKMMSLDLDEQIKVGQKVLLGVKPTHIAVAKNLQGELSYSNQLCATIENIDQGELLSVIYATVFQTPLQSIITTQSAQRMALKKGQEITLLIKASDLSILDVNND